jgi:transcriptional regulator GlxA family with amidase domain
MKETISLRNGVQMKIAIALYPRFTALDAIGPLEVLSSLPGAHVHLVAEERGPVTNDTGLLTVTIDTSLDELPHPDLIVVPGGPGCFAAMRSERLLAWVRAAHATTRYTTSVCTGALILGAAGLLQGAQATTHWGSFADLPALGATYVRERFVRTGRVITAAGVSAGIDMALCLVRELADEPTMAAIQLLIEYDPHPPAPMRVPPTSHEELTEHDWRVMEARAGRPLSRDHGSEPTL